PVRLDTPTGAKGVFTLRSLADCRRIIDGAKTAKRAIVIGSGFIGMEAAAALRARGLEVAVVAPEAGPMLKALGPELGGFLGRLHEAHGVQLHLGRSVVKLESGMVKLGDDSVLEADLVLVGVGVRPRVELARAAGLKVEGGIVVDRYLRSSEPGVWA